MSEIAVAFCIYNRPGPTARVLNAIREYRPKRLLAIADGPKRGNSHDAEQVHLTRQILTQVDWPCDVIHCWSDENLGCKNRMASGLTWAFEQAERLIVLEDDCLPHPSFFQFCETLLDRYADEPRVAMISGNNFQPHRLSDDSYFFSRWTHIWGWASWRRAWNAFDVNIADWPSVKALPERLRAMVDSDEEARHWEDLLDQVHAGTIDTWDFSWMFACWQSEAMAILPQVNLVSNIGFGSDATHTKDPASCLANMPTFDIGPLKHPTRITRNVFADQLTFERIFRRSGQPLESRSESSLQRLVALLRLRRNAA